MTRFEAEEILDLPDRYDMAEVRSAFKALAQRYHPDNAARNGISPEVAQRKMTQVNKAYAYMRKLLAAGEVTSLHRDYVGGRHGKKGVGVHFDPSGFRAVDTQVDDSLFWDENGNPRSAVAENEANQAADAPGHGLRRFLLGPVFLRLVFVALLALVWWRSFPLLGPGQGRLDLSGDLTLDLVADFMAALIYPSYFLLYELLTGHISGAVREIANGIVSNATGTHVEVRKRGSYRSDVSSLVSVQLYSVLEIPLAVWLFARGMSSAGTAHLVFLGLAVLVVADLMLGFFGTGLVVALARWLSERIEHAYVTARMDMLKRCGQWASGKHARPQAR